MAPFSVVPNGNDCNTGAETPADMVATLVWIEAVHLIAQRQTTALVRALAQQQITAALVQQFLAAARGGRCSSRLQQHACSSPGSGGKDSWGGAQMR